MSGSIITSRDFTRIIPDYYLRKPCFISATHPTKKWSRLLFSGLLVTQRLPIFRVTLTCILGGIGQPLSLLLKTNPLITEVQFCYHVLHWPDQFRGLAWSFRYCQHPW